MKPLRSSGLIPIVLMLSFSASSVAHDEPSSAIPSEINVAEGQQLLMSVNALGQQVYRCQNTAQTGSPEQLSWVLQEPIALLLDQDNKVVGSHFKGPVWRLNDGSSATGEVKAKAEVDAASIPWLLLKVKAHEGEGKMSAVNWVQRTQTDGGKAPQSCTEEYKNSQLRVPYKAEYLLYGDKN
jgi:Protein of unknown function (DUF3455)